MDQSGRDWVVLIALMFDLATTEQQDELLRLLANEIGEDELEMNVIGGNDDELDP